MKRHKRRGGSKATPKNRCYIVLAHIKRAGAGAGPHSKRGYSRKVKHKKGWSTND